MSDNDAYYGVNYDTPSDADEDDNIARHIVAALVARWDSAIVGPYFQWEDDNVWELYGAPPESTITFDDGTLLTVQGHSLKIIQVTKENTAYWPEPHTALALTHAWNDVHLLLSLLQEHAPHLFPTIQE